MSINFCDIHACFDSHFFDTVPGDSWYVGRDYCLRMLVSNWLKGPPAAYQTLDFAKRIAALPGAMDLCDRYWVKGVLLGQIPQGYDISYAVDKWYSMQFGSGCNESFTSDAGTWTIDLVFQPRLARQIYIKGDKLIEYLEKVLVTNAGSPTAYFGGLVDLIPKGCDAKGYEDGRAFWAGHQAYWEITKNPSELSDSGYRADPIQINNKAPGIAWSKPGYVGEDGKGIALGNAFEPVSLQPLPISGTIQPQPGQTQPTQPSPGTPGVPGYVSGTPIDTSLGPISWRTLSTPQKAVAVGGGALATWAIMKYVLGW